MNKCIYIIRCKNTKKFNFRSSHIVYSNHYGYRHAGELRGRLRALDRQKEVVTAIAIGVTTSNIVVISEW